MGTKNLAEDPYEKLANAIIVQASKDYMANLRKKKRNPGSASAEHDIKECERFFRSDWYQVLTSVDGEYLMGRLRKEVLGAKQDNQSQSEGNKFSVGGTYERKRIFGSGIKY